LPDLLAWAIHAIVVFAGVALLAILAWNDARRFRLPFAANCLFLALGLLAGHLVLGTDQADSLIGAGAGYLFLAGIAALYRRIRGREGIGGGDPILLSGIGAWLGWQELPYIVLMAAMTGLAFALLQRLARNRRNAWQRQRVPLGTCLAFATIAAGIFRFAAGTG